MATEKQLIPADEDEIKLYTYLGETLCEYSDKSTPRIPDESTPDLVTNNPSYFTAGLY